MMVSLILIVGLLFIGVIQLLACAAKSVISFIVWLLS